MLPQMGPLFWFFIMMFFILSYLLLFVASYFKSLLFLSVGGEELSICFEFKF